MININAIIIQQMIENGDCIHLLYNVLKSSKRNDIKCIVISILRAIAIGNEKWSHIVVSDGIYKYVLQNIGCYLQIKDKGLCIEALRFVSSICESRMASWHSINICVNTFDEVLTQFNELIETENENENILISLLECIHCTRFYAYNRQYYIDIMNTTLIPHLLSLLQIDYKTIDSVILARCLKIIICLFTNNNKINIKNKYKRNQFIDYMVNNGYLKLYRNLLNHSDDDMKNIRRMYCHGLSFICCGFIYNKYGILYYDAHALLKLLISKCILDEDKIKIECGRCLSNIILCNKKEVIDFLCKNNVINSLKYLMKTSSVKKPLIRCIESFDIILSKTQFPRNKGSNDYIYKVKKVGLVDVFDILQSGVDDTDAVFKCSLKLAQKYYDEDVNDDLALITYVPLINDIYHTSKDTKQYRLIFNVDLIKDYLFKFKKITFPIHKINAVIITCIVQSIAYEIAAKASHISSLITICSLRSVFKEIPTLNKMLRQFDYKLDDKLAKRAYECIAQKITQKTFTRDSFNDVLSELGIDIDKYGDILFHLISGMNDIINAEKWIYFISKTHSDFDDTTFNEVLYTSKQLDEIRYIFIHNIKQYIDSNMEYALDIVDKMKCVERNIAIYIKNKHHIHHRNLVENDTIVMERVKNDDNICNKLTEIALFYKIFSYFNYDEIICNIYIVNKLFHAVSVPLLDTLYINKIYSLHHGYFNASIYTLKLHTSFYNIRLDAMMVFNAILLDTLDTIIEKIQMKYVEHWQSNKKEFILYIENNVIHQFLAEIFEPDIVLKLEKKLILSLTEQL